MNDIFIYILLGILSLAVVFIMIFLSRRNSILEKKNSQLNNQNMQLIQENAKLLTDLDHEKKRFEESKEVREQLTLVFKNLSNEIIKEQKKDFGETQKNTFETHVTPLRSEIQNFRQQMERMKEDQSNGRTELITQLNLFKEINISLQKEAAELAKALKGDKKLQGNWGEIQLERLLEITGFQEGRDYTKQESFIVDDKRNIPDYVLTLPDNRRVVIDSKVSLNNYAEYVNTEDEEKKQSYLRAFVGDIRNHIKSLSSKEYNRHIKENSLDFVFMFMPLEHAYIEALRADPKLYQDAYENNIAITTPSSLLPILRTVEVLWKVEKRHQHVEEIAAVGGDLYDKLVSFSENLIGVGDRLRGAQSKYDDALKQLKTGRGNAISIAEKLRILGAKTTKKMDATLLEEQEQEPKVISATPLDNGDLFSR